MKYSDSDSTIHQLIRDFSAKWQNDDNEYKFIMENLKSDFDKRKSFKNWNWIASIHKACKEFNVIIKDNKGIFGNENTNRIKKALGNDKKTFKILYENGYIDFKNLFNENNEMIDEVKNLLKEKRGWNDGYVEGTAEIIRKAKVRGGNQDFQDDDIESLYSNEKIKDKLHQIDSTESENLIIATDGSWKRKQRLAGYGLIVTTTNKYEIHKEKGRVRGNQTNYSAELTALIRGIEIANLNDNFNWKILTDYDASVLIAQKMRENKYKIRRNQKERILLEKLKEVIQTMGDNVEIKWIKAHQDILPQNKRRNTELEIWANCKADEYAKKGFKYIPGPNGNLYEKRSWKRFDNTRHPEGMNIVDQDTKEMLQGKSSILLRKKYRTEEHNKWKIKEEKFDYSRTYIDLKLGGQGRIPSDPILSSIFCMTYS